MKSIALWAEPSRRRGDPEWVLRLLIAAVFTVVLVSGLAYAFLGMDFLTHSDLGLPCAFRSVTGSPCPGCGMTRAFLLLSQLRINDALATNPAAPFLAGAMLWRLATSRGALLREHHLGLANLVAFEDLMNHVRIRGGVRARMLETRCFEDDQAADGPTRVVEQRTGVTDASGRL